MADPEMLARVCALVNMRNRADNPSDNALNMAVQSTNVAAKINGLSDKVNREFFRGKIWFYFEYLLCGYN